MSRPLQPAESLAKMTEFLNRNPFWRLDCS
jgi:hypothetical protein